ncbi:MAG: hypothetical protein HY984_02535 [Candidatus Magasanikbacteria bacterium]|nr:hypothetical protein [Candidatus Magasanikbacteria bacterium]
MKKETVVKILQRAGLKRPLHLEPFGSGMSGSWIWKVLTKEFGWCIFKYNYNRLWLRCEDVQAGKIRDPLAGMIVPVHCSGPAFILTEYVPDTLDLARILHNGVAGERRAEMLHAVSQVLYSMRSLWLTQCFTVNAVMSLYQSTVIGKRKKPFPVGRAGKYVRQLLRKKGMYDLPVVVNGCALGFSVAHALKAIHMVLARPLKTGRLLHGDLRPDNILLSNDRGVRLIDPRVGETDWARDLSLLIRSENMRTLQALQAEEFAVEGGRLILRYIPTFDPLCSVIAEQCLAFGDRFAAVTDDPTWRIRASMYIASVYMNDIRLFERRHQGGVIPRFRHIVTYLLGEALRAVASAKEDQR